MKNYQISSLAYPFALECDMTTANRQYLIEGILRNQNRYINFIRRNHIKYINYDTSTYTYNFIMYMLLTAPGFLYPPGAVPVADLLRGPQEGGPLVGVSRQVQVVPYPLYQAAGEVVYRQVLRES